MCSPVRERDDSILASLSESFRTMIEESADNILRRVGPTTAARLFGLAEIADGEARSARSYESELTAHALAAALRRRARSLEDDATGANSTPHPHHAHAA